MGDKTDISWADRTLNGWIGCNKISPACDHCYAATSRASAAIGVVWGAGQARHRTSAENWKLPLRWNARPFWQCSCGYRGDDEGGGHNCTLPLASPKPARRRVFCASLADVFDNEVSAEWLADLLDLIRRTPNLDWLLLTKRIGNWSNRLAEAVHALDGGFRKGEATGDLCDWIESWIGGGATPANVWIGATICNQAEADRDVPKLLRVPATVRFLSIEPMLGPVILTSVGQIPANEDGPNRIGYMVGPDDGKSGLWPTRERALEKSGLHWVIAGGEIGSHARPSHPDWFRSMRDQCAAAGVPFLFKQWGEHSLEYDRDRDDPDWRSCNTWDRKPGRWINLAGGHGFHGERVHYAHRVGKKAAGCMLDGRIHHEFPGEKSYVG